MAEVDFLEPRERVITNPFIDIPRARDSTAITPTSPTSGLTERPLQDSFSPQHHRPESSVPVIEGELVFEEPQAFESRDEFRERQRREWAESDERLLKDLQQIDQEYDDRIAEIEAQTPRNRGQSATTAAKAAGAVMAAAEGFSTFVELRNEGAGFFESVGGTAGTIGGGLLGGQAAQKASLGLGLGATIKSGGTAGVAAGAAVGAATVAGSAVGANVGGAIGGAIGKALDDFADWLGGNPDGAPAPDETTQGPDPGGNPGGDPSDPGEYPDGSPIIAPIPNPDGSPGGDYTPAGGVLIEWQSQTFGPQASNVLSYSTSAHPTNEALGLLTRVICNGEERITGYLLSVGVNVAGSGRCFTPDPEPIRPPLWIPKPIAPNPRTPRPFRPIGLPTGIPLPDFGIPTSPTGEPSDPTDPLEPGNPRSKPAPRGNPGDLPQPEPAPTSEPRSPTAPTDSPKNPSFGPSGNPGSGPSGAPGGSPRGGGSSSGSGSSPTSAPTQSPDFTPDLPGYGPEWKPYNNPTEQPDLEPVELPPTFEQADTPEKCDPCSKLDQILGLLRNEFSNSIQFIDCEGTAPTYQDAITNSGFSGLSATNQLILNGITEIWEKVKCGDEGGVASIPESYLPKAPTIKPQLQVQFKESGKKSGSRWHITIPHFNEAFKDSVNFSPYLRGNVRCVLSLTDNTKIIVNAVNKSAGQAVISQCLSYVKGQYQTPLSQISYYEVPSQDIRQITVEATYCKYFTGTLEEPPKWTRKLPQ